MNRREFLLAAGVAAALPVTVRAQHRTSSADLKVGILGVGMRGLVHLQELLRRDDVAVTAICDTDAFTIGRALGQFARVGKPGPRVYTGDDYAWREMYATSGIDAVFIVTPWEWHAQQAIEAMHEHVAVGCEVVAGVTLDDHWRVLAAQQVTRTPYMLLENVCYRRDVMAVLRMVREGLFGELVHLQGGYQHDLRAVKFNSGDPAKPYGGGVEFGAKGWSEARWRTAHSVRRNGDLYPSHGIGPLAVMCNVHRGNRFTHIGSYASKARGLHDYVARKMAAPDHPSAQARFALGDVVTTHIACANGETILLQHDTSLPRPYSLGFRVQGGLACSRRPNGIQ